jgi:hypothetical protein
MLLSREEVKDHILQDLSERFNKEKKEFKDDDDLRDQWLFDDKSLREWGKKLNNAPWFCGSIKPSEIIVCQKIKDVIDLMFVAQGRQKSRPQARQRT